MANVTITDLPALSTMTDSDVIPVVNVGANVTQKITGTNLKTYFTSNVTSLSVTGSVTAGNLVSAGNIAGAGDFDIDGDGTIGGNLFVTGNINFSGNVNQISGNSGSFFGNAAGVGALYAGIPVGYANVVTAVIQATSDLNDYTQINAQNLNHGNTASMEYVVTGDFGTDTTDYIDLGFSSSTWNGTQTNSLGTAVAARDGFLYVQGGGGGGNLVIGTTTAGRSIKFNAGGPGSANTVAQISNTGLTMTGIVSATGNVDAGNLRTAGSVSLTGNLTVGSSMSVFRGDATLPDVISQSKTTGTIQIGGSATTGNVTLNPSQANSQTNIATGVFGAGITKGINIGTGGTANSQTNFVIGPFTGTGNFFVQQGTTVTIASPSANALSVTGNITGGNILTSGSLSVTGATSFVNVGSASGLQATATNNDFIGTNKTTGDITIGGTGQTGTILVGRSTANSLINIGTGATTSGNTKSINIGTNGVAGSNTNILLGPISGGSGGVGLVQTQGNTTVRITNTGANALSVAGTVTGANIVLPPVAFANLTAIAGGRATINNANLVAAGNFGANVSGGGSNVVPVWSDGTNWYIG